MNRKKKAEQIIRTLDKKTQAVRNFSAAYDMECGAIELGCEENYVSCAIWHETIHKILFEQFYFEANCMWDNIAQNIQEFLFEIKTPEQSYVYTIPTPSPKEEDGGRWRNGTKQREKSERTGYQSNYKKRVPVRSPKQILEEK